jgi:hypothetical protein
LGTAVREIHRRDKGRARRERILLSSKRVEIPPKIRMKLKRLR